LLQQDIRRLGVRETRPRQGADKNQTNQDTFALHGSVACDCFFNRQLVPDFKLVCVQNLLTMQPVLGRADSPREPVHGGEGEHVAPTLSGLNVSR
jgi:hypothetical protein